MSQTDNGRHVAEALREAGRGASVAMTEVGGAAYRMGTKTGAQIAHEVEARPMTSVVIAASLGLITGLLLSRR
jgi:ElaB/YqjD/DUF883 family membrane-anchored ribosome-binding protein